MPNEDNVVPLLPASPENATPKTTEKQDRHAVAARLTPKLATAFACIPTMLIQGAQRLRPNGGARGLNNTEVMTLIHILDRKWDERKSYPAITTMAEQMGLKPRAIRAAIKRLEDLGYLKRFPMPNGGPNKYDVSGLFAALEKLMDEDVAAADATQVAAEAKKG